VSKPSAIIDLDNCISDDFWRIRFIDLSHPVINDRYHQYHSRCHLDLPGDTVAQVRELALTHTLLVFTSRPEAVRRQTLQWLQEWHVKAEEVYMRPNDCHLHSIELKEIMLSKARDKGYAPEYAIDDRQEILKVYADNGVPRVKRVFIHDNTNHLIEHPVRS